uniref:Reprolysin n=1 Tax=Rhipicephalus appendiculatus TaxID=34631 RepID=A0A131Z1S6_RHIAP
MKAQRGQAAINLLLLTATLASGQMYSHSIVYPTILESRSINGTKAIKLNDDITLNLVPTDVISSTFVLSTATKLNLEHKETGIVGERLRIEPLPFSGRTSSGVRPHHLFYARNILARDDVIVPRSVNNTSRSDRRKKPFQRFSNFAVVEVYVLIDVLFSAHFPKDADAINYLAVTIAAVNLRYRSVKRIEIKFRLVGMLRLSSELEEEFVTKYGTYIDGQPTLLRLQMFCYRSGLDKADVRYFITGRDITGVYRGRMNAIMGGFAYVGGLCSLDGVAIGEDTPGLYAGVDIMAHELAHSMGCVHDGEGARTEIPGHKGSTAPECAAYRGYLMSYSRNGGKNHHKLSPCCEEQIKIFLRLVADECVEETFNVTQIITRRLFLPGHWITPQRYCKLKQPSLKIASPYTLMANSKCKLQCLYAGSYNRPVEYEALDGMRCEGGRWCEKGVCI